MFLDFFRYALSCSAWITASEEPPLFSGDLAQNVSKDGDM
jgi:hypothetical protein